MGILRRIIDNHISSVIAEVVPKLLDERLPAIIDRIAADRFASDPAARLTEAGFGLAMSLALRAHWPELSRVEATRLMWEYVEVPFGADGYDWTPLGAKEIALAYASEFGERP